MPLDDFNVIPPNESPALKRMREEAGDDSEERHKANLERIDEAIKLRNEERERQRQRRKFIAEQLGGA